MGNHLTDKIKWCRSLIFKKMSTCFLSYKLISGCLLISGHTGLFQLYISDCGSKVLVLVGLRQVFLWETQETNIAGDAGMTDIVLVSTNSIFQYSLNSFIPFTLTWKMKFFTLILIFPSCIFFLFFLFFNFYPFILRVNWIGYMEWVLSIQYKDLNVC